MSNPVHPGIAGLPHGESFRFVDSVIELEPGSCAVCERVFASSEPFFSGHFPGNPMVPGVILTEALAQTAGIAAAVSRGTSLRLSAIRSMKFFHPVRPGQRVILAAKLAGVAGELFQFQVCARVGESVVAEGSVVLNQVRESAPSAEIQSLHHDR